MAIEKSYLKSKPICKVTFKINKPEAETVEVLGDFNNWQAGECSLKKLKSGDFKGTLNVDSENTYEFKYLVDGNFELEPEADGTVVNNFGSENSVLSV